jgi:hypothetical protein
LIYLSALLLFVVACEPYQLPTLQPTRTSDPQVEATQTQMPEAESSEAESSEAESPEAESSEAESPEATETPEAEPTVMMPSLNLPEGRVGLVDGGIALSGRGEPGTEVQVLVDDQIVGVTEVGSGGSWSLETTVVEAGDHQLVVQTLDVEGAVMSESEPVSVSVTAPQVTATTPEFIFPIDGADLLMGPLTLVGYGQAGTEVEVVDGTAVLGLAEVNAAGEWTYTFAPTEGEHQLAARLPGDETAMSDLVVVLVTSDKDSIDCNFSNPGINRGDTYIVGTCDTLNEISQDLTLDFDALVEANPQLNPDLDLIYPGQILNLPQ